MAFTQYRTREELDAAVDKKGLENVFITEDHRVYTEVEFADDAVFIKLDRKEMRGLLDLKSHLDMLTDGFMEMKLNEVDEAAASFRKCLEEVLETLGHKPRTREEKIGKIRKA